MKIVFAFFLLGLVRAQSVEQASSDPIQKLGNNY